MKINNIFLINISLLIFSLFLIFYTSNFPFYWDNTTQISVPANWYYATDFQYFYLPDNIATGHPTFVGMYFAFAWKLFGKSLLVSHLAMFPFVFGLLYQLHNLLRNIKIEKTSIIVLILLIIILDATFLSQLSLITFDVIQLFFYFLCLNSVIKNEKKALIFYFTILILISLRGAIMACGLLIFNLSFDYFIKQKIKVKNYLIYLPGIISLFMFLLLFQINKGWIIHNTVSGEWSDSVKFADSYLMLRNIGLFIWRLIDFGRIGFFIFFLIFMIKSLFAHKFPDHQSKILFFAAFSQFIVLFPILIIYQNPFGHRYLLPIIIPVFVLTINWIYQNTKLSSLWLLSAIIVLLSGHFWLYPLKVSQGWDSTTLHWKYFKVTEKMNTYIENAEIATEDIETYFPNKSRYLLYLEDDERSYYKGNAFGSKYILYSNTFNINDNVIDSLFSKSSRWELVKKYSDHQIFVSLYKKDTTKDY